MSEIVDTRLGRFRRVTDGKSKWFLFECSQCKEWMPLSEAAMEGTEPVIHESADIRGTRCMYSAPQEFGKTRVATLQARRLMGLPTAHEDVP